MRRLAVLLLAAALASGPAAARDLAAIKTAGTIRVGTEGAFPPFNFFRGKALTGFEVELAQALAAKLGLKYQWTTLGFDALLPALNQDRFDFVIASHGITPARQRAVDFSRPHYCTGGVIVYRAGGPATAAALAGKRVSVQVGTTYLENVQKVSGVAAGDIRTFPKDTDALQNLLAGRVDAWVTDRFVALDAVKANANAGLKIGEALFTERIAMAVRKNNSALLGALNSALIGLENDGTYAKISNRYFGEDVRCR